MQGGSCTNKSLVYKTNTGYRDHTCTGLSPLLSCMLRLTEDSTIALTDSNWSASTARWTAASLSAAKISALHPPATNCKGKRK